MKTLIVRTLVLVGCTAGAIVTAQETTPSSEMKKIAIAMYMTHPALDSLKASVIEQLSKEGFIEGQNVHYLPEKNAHNSITTAALIASDLASRNLDVIVAIATPMAEAVVKHARCPVVFAAVTDPVGAGIIRSLDTPEKMVTGTSDAWPYEDQLRLIRRISPNAKRLGVLFNPGEAASQYGIRQIRRIGPTLGFKLVEGSVSSTGDVYPVAQNLAPRVDALFLSSDNTVIAGVAAAVKVAVKHKIPLYVGDSGTVEKGGVATVSVGYAQLGVETGKLVARILRGERNIPPIVATGSDIYLNTKAAEMMGVTIPDDVLASAIHVFDSIAVDEVEGRAQIVLVVLGIIAVGLITYIGFRRKAQRKGGSE